MQLPTLHGDTVVAKISAAVMSLSPSSHSSDHNSHGPQLAKCWLSIPHPPGSTQEQLWSGFGNVKFLSSMTPYVRYRCTTVLQSAMCRSTAYRKTDVDRTDYRNLFSKHFWRPKHWPKAIKLLKSIKYLDHQISHNYISSHQFDQQNLITFQSYFDVMIFKILFAPQTAMKFVWNKVI